MSIGFDSALSGIERYFLAGALRSAQENGILLVSAAGNDGKRAPHEYICWYGGPTSICVGALDDNNTQNALASFSNWGEKVDIAAYGEDVYAGSDQGYGVYFSGTSVSTPIVAGFAAILISMGVDPMLVKPLMLANAAPLVPSDHPIRHNGGALNALETVRHAITLLPSRNPRGLRGNFNLGLDK
ncbi:hypothetical protein FOZ61_000603 [Perkinsus olseni]|uniref:subtilisin n=1 Tax=Perkinsus olseni TaxID=32597 RepID=A0A7J6MPB9_PEROL|nr:hypothetical protein FOZ61_000603 [Perkinsus olseni]KAF4673443.1 hypothetical protein FOL46_007232 [Perkinsus olseni]